MMHGFVEKMASIIFAISLFCVLPVVFAADDKAQEGPLDVKIDHIKLANKYRSEEKWELARNEYSEIIKADPKVPRHYISRGFIELELKDFTAAIADANKVNAITNFNGYLGLASFLRARAYLGLKNMNESIKQYLDATARMPGHADAQFELGKLFYRQKRYDEALVCLNKANEKFARSKTDKRLIGLAGESKKMIDDIENKQKTAQKNKNTKKGNKGPD